MRHGPGGVVILYKQTIRIIYFSAFKAHTEPRFKFLNLFELLKLLICIIETNLRFVRVDFYINATLRTQMIIGGPNCMTLQRYKGIIKK